MRSLYISLAVVWLLQLVNASAGDLQVLQPVPRFLWDKSVRKRDDLDASQAANVTLGDFEQMLWSSNKTNHSAIVSMVVWTGQNRKIVDMAKFAWELKAVNCTSNMMVQFRHNASFQAAKRDWEWVNFNSMRSFVMVADHIKCGRDWSPEPWVVSNARYDAATLTVRLDAEKQTWKKITHSYQMDFGELDMGQQPGHPWKRFLDFNAEGAFTVDLSSSWPTEVFTANWDNLTFGITCDGCGTKGSLVFAGHIEGSVFGGIDHFMVSATPHGIEANLNMAVKLGGAMDLSDKDWANDEFVLATIPLPAGWTIPGILTFGPNAKIIAGYGLKSIEGSATISTGVTAKVPDDSIAKVDLFAQKKVDVHGWVPTVETKPLEVAALITATGEIYTKVAVAVSLEILDENGVNVDIGLKMPDFKITATGGYNSDGFCPGSTDPFGISLDVYLGASLELEGWDEVDGKRHTLFDVSLFATDDLFHFPVQCFHFGSAPAGSCAVVPSSDDLEWYNNEVVGWDDTEARRRRRQRNVDVALAAREPYYMGCDKDRKWPIHLKPYYSPSKIKSKNQAGSGVPIMLPLIACSDADSKDCLPDRWKVEESTDPGVISQGRWAAEHVYEGNWIRDYLNELYEKHFKQEGEAAGCELLANTFKINQGAGYADDLVSNIGNKQTYTTMMTLLPQRENEYKHRFFVDKAIDNQFQTNVAYGGGPADAHTRACTLGRFINTCKYMAMEKTQQRMINTITAFETIFDRMDSDANVPKPGGLTSYKSTHKTWFTAMYGAGINKARDFIVSSAKFLNGTADFSILDPTLQSAITAVGAGAIDERCTNTFLYP